MTIFPEKEWWTKLPLAKNPIIINLIIGCVLYLSVEALVMSFGIKPANWWFSLACVAFLSSYREEIKSDHGPWVPPSKITVHDVYRIVFSILGALMTQKFIWFLGSL